MDRNSSSTRTNRVEQDVMTNGDVTAIRLTYTSNDGTTMIGEGFAKRSIEDVKNPQIGEDLALGRALSALGSQLKRKAWGDIKKADRANQRQYLKDLERIAKISQNGSGPQNNKWKDIKKAVTANHNLEAASK